MNPTDARDKNNLYRVKNFNAKDHFESDISKKKWDRIKVICTQPFNKVYFYYSRINYSFFSLKLTFLNNLFYFKNLSYGLSFIRVFNLDNDEEKDEVK